MASTAALPTGAHALAETSPRPPPQFSLERWEATRAQPPGARTPPAGARPALVNEGIQSVADYAGNRTVISVAERDILVLKREADCSLTRRDISYTVLAGPTLTYSLNAATLGYETVLHNLAGLTTTPGQFTSDCGDPAISLPSRRGVYLGATTSGIRSGFAYFYDFNTDRDRVFGISINADDSLRQAMSMNNPNNAAGVTGGDFDEDGNRDLVSINDPVYGTSAAPSISVFRANADGSFQAPLRIDLSGIGVISAVVADVNDDTHLDIAVSTQDAGGNYALNVVTGKGNGSFNAPVSTALTPPAGAQGTSPYHGFIAADLTDSGHMDLVTGDGIVLLGHGDGSFSQSAQLAFCVPKWSSTRDAPNVVAADLDGDNDLDLATNTGKTIGIHLGAGDGSFALAHAYANNENTGYLTVADLDGDGRLDLFSGLGNDGIFMGDQFAFNQGYALLGHGDGRFAGAPAQAFLYTGNNLGDLNGDGRTDAVGVNADLSLTAYLGDGQGGFAPAGTVQTTPITLSGREYTLNDIDSYALGDVDGDQKADLVYLGKDFNGPGDPFGGPGFFIARGNGDGSFAAPTFQAVPYGPYIPAGAIDYGLAITGLRLADVNGDGRADVLYRYSDGAYQIGQPSLPYYFGNAVQLSTGGGTFQPAQVIPFYSGPSQYPRLSNIAAVNDFNGDHKADLLFLTESGNMNGTLAAYPNLIELRLGHGDGSFADPVAIDGPELMGNLQQSSQYARVAVADMNGDGMPDLVTLGSSADGSLQLAVTPGHGDGSFGTAIRKTLGAQYLPDDALAVADFNGDGDPDLALSGYTGSADTGIFFGNGDGTLQSVIRDGAALPNQILHLLTGGPTVALELNGDGTPDILSGPVTLLSVPPATGVSAVANVALQASTTRPALNQAVQLNVTVSAENGTEPPTGSVTFLDGDTPLTSTALSVSGTATLSVANLSAGAHALSVRYAGDSRYTAGRSATVNVVVVSDSTATGVLQQTESADPVTAGQPFSYVVKFSNLANTGALQTRLVDTLPARSKLASAVPSQGSCKGKQPVVCTFGTVAPGATVSLTVTLTRMKPGSVKNKAITTYKMTKAGTKRLKAYRLVSTESTTLAAPE